LIYTGFGIGPLPAHLMTDDVAQGRFQQLPPENGVTDLDIHLLWSSDRKLSAAESAFLEALHAFLDGKVDGQRG